MPYTDPFAISRQDRLKGLWKEDAGKAGVDAYKRRMILEREYAREQPDEPLRAGADDPLRTAAK
jgi:hypothetical protein